VTAALGGLAPAQAAVVGAERIDEFVDPRCI